MRAGRLSRAAVIGDTVRTAVNDGSEVLIFVASGWYPDPSDSQ